MNYERIVELLTEFDYKKNTKEDTIGFLVYMLNCIINK